MRKILLMGLVVSLILGLGVLAVSAQDDTGDDETTFPFGFGRGMMMAGFDGSQNSMMAVAAEALGMDWTELMTALHSGQTLAEIAEAQGVELAALTEAFDAAHEEQLAAAVEAGYLTEEQAAAMEALHEANMAAFLSGDNADMLGGMFGFGGRGPGMMWNSDTETDGQFWGGGMFGGRGHGRMWNSDGQAGRGPGMMWNQN